MTLFNFLKTWAAKEPVLVVAGLVVVVVAVATGLITESAVTSIVNSLVVIAGGFAARSQVSPVKK